MNSFLAVLFALFSINLFAQVGENGTVSADCHKDKPNSTACKLLKSKEIKSCRISEDKNEIFCKEKSHYRIYIYQGDTRSEALAPKKADSSDPKHKKNVSHKDKTIHIYNYDDRGLSK